MSNISNAFKTEKLLSALLQRVTLILTHHLKL